MSERRLFGQPHKFWLVCGHFALFRKPFPAKSEVVLCPSCGDFREVAGNRNPLLTRNKD